MGEESPHLSRFKGLQRNQPIVPDTLHLMPLSITINGQQRDFPHLASPASLAALIDAMELKADRVAVELNREIAQRTLWDSTEVRSGDRLEIVHFVGGGKSL
jgi:thiamine biosynthesis protein ThiS